MAYTAQQYFNQIVANEIEMADLQTLIAKMPPGPERAKRQARLALVRRVTQQYKTKYTRMTGTPWQDLPRTTVVEEKSTPRKQPSQATPPPTPQAPRIRRLRHREFRDSEGRDMFELSQPDPAGDSVDKLIKYWATRGESVHGSEFKASRKTVTVPQTHRVVAVKILTESSSEVGLLYTAKASNTYVTYEWGPPGQTVRVTWITREKDLNTGKVTVSSRTKTIPRSKAAGNAVFFPPEP